MSASNANPPDKFGHHPPGQSIPRLLYVDNLRVFLIVLVVLHHTAIGYGGSGGWVLYEKATDTVSPVLLTLFNTINQSFFMSFFFLISGYFVPQAFDKKGPKNFIKDRLIRLWIPVLIYMVLIWQLVEYVLINFARGENAPFYEIMVYHFSNLDFEVGPLWFLEALLLFTLVYAACRLASDRLWPGLSFKPYNHGFPTKKTVFLGIAAISMGTFIVRTAFPVGAQIYHFQVGHFVHYAFSFWLGILASRAKWFENLKEQTGRFWAKIALITLTALPIIYGIALIFEVEEERFTGGFSWFSLLYSIWESFACLSIIITLSYIFQKRFNSQRRLFSEMSSNAYTVYIIHQLVVVSLMAVFLPIALPSIVKFFIVASISLPVCFLISHFIVRNIPYARRVLG